MIFGPNSVCLLGLEREMKGVTKITISFALVVKSTKTNMHDRFFFILLLLLLDVFRRDIWREAEMRLSSRAGRQWARQISPPALAGTGKKNNKRTRQQAIRVLWMFIWGL